MAANTAPIFTLTGNPSSVLVTAGNTSSQGGGTVATDIFLCFTAGANGAYVDALYWIPTATTPTTTGATVGRAFVSSVSAGATTSANTWLLPNGEVALPAVGADNASTANNPIVVPIGLVIPSGQFLLVTNHATPAANTAWRAFAAGNNY